MSIARKWVFPIIWIVIFAAIASALVKIAFFPDRSDASDPAVPSAEIVDPQYAVTIGTVRNDVTLTGTVAADAAVPIRRHSPGVREVSPPGQSVSAGGGISCCVARSSIPTERRAPSGEGHGTGKRCAVHPHGSMVSSSRWATALEKISPPGFHVSGSIPPEQLYRLIQRPTDAQVTITGGPAPFTCTNLTISTGQTDSVPGGGNGGSGGTGDSGSGTVVSCAIPSDVTVFPGLSAQLVLAGGIAENVLVVPITAVEGAGGTGNVYFVLPDGSTELREVTLGLNDGVNVEVTAGLKEGDLILQFVPGAPSPTDGGMVSGNCYSSAGGMVCQG